MLSDKMNSQQCCYNNNNINGTKADLKGNHPM